MPNSKLFYSAKIECKKYFEKFLSSKTWTNGRVMGPLHIVVDNGDKKKKRDKKAVNHCSKRDIYIKCCLDQSRPLCLTVCDQ